MSHDVSVSRTSDPVLLVLGAVAGFARAVSAGRQKKKQPRTTRPLTNDELAPLDVHAAAIVGQAADCCDDDTGCDYDNLFNYYRVDFQKIDFAWSPFSVLLKAVTLLAGACVCAHGQSAVAHIADVLMQRQPLLWRHVNGTSSACLRCWLSLLPWTSTSRAR